MKNNKIIAERLDFYWRVFNLASRLYSGKNRKASGLPHLSHAEMVKEILVSYSAEPDVCAAGLLHDALNCNYSYEKLARAINKIVANFVLEVADFKKIEDNELPFGQKRELLSDKFCKISEQAKLILVAEKIHNLWSLAEDFRAHRDDIWERLQVNREEMFLRYNYFFQLITAYFFHPIISDYREIYQEASALLNWPKN